MISFKSCIELIHVIDGYGVYFIDRIFAVFGLDHLIKPILGKFTKEDKVNILLKQLKYPPDKGIFTDSFRMDLLQFIVDNYYRSVDNENKFSFKIYRNGPEILYDDKFSDDFISLSNSLKRDGYIIKGKVIKKLLPEEIEEAKSEDELFFLLSTFGFETTKGHLTQGISNHSQGNWAGANSQFRTFIESLLIDISRWLLPQNKCETASNAINLLSKTVSPSFLKAELNEVESTRCDKPYIEGLWKRLHPEGTHPGLSDEADSTFRYHITLVTGHYLIKRLEKWK